MIIEVKPPTRAEVEKWLKLARLRKLNIYYDKNEIIVNLCEELLKKWDRE
jgi:hypothetical protein